MDSMSKIWSKIEPSILAHHKLIFTIFLILVIVISSIVVISRPYLAGADTYYYINYVCYGTPIDKPILSEMFFSLLPCNNMLVWKFIQIGLFILSIIIIGFIGREFDKKYGYLTSLVLFFGTSIFVFLANLEPQQIGVTILFLSLLFIIKHYNTHKKIYIIISFILTCLACLFWNGSYIFFLIYAIFYPLILIPFSIIAIIFNKMFLLLFSTVLPNLEVVENYPFLGIIWWSFLLVGMFTMFKQEIKLKLIFMVLLIIGIVNSKYSILVVPLLAVGSFLWLKTRSFDYKKVLIIIFILLTFITFGLMSVYNSIPTKDIMNDINTSYQYSIDNNLGFENDWSLGYYSQYLGINVKYKGNIEKDGYDFNNSIVVAIKEDNIDNVLKRDCNKLDITKTLNTYKC